MPSFGTASLAQLKTCDSRLQFLFLEVVKTYDCKVVEGFRGKAAQDYAYDHGFSKVKWPDGNHNHQPSLAADVYPYPIDPKMDSPTYAKRMIHFAGYVQGTAQKMGIPIRWGGDWSMDFIMADERFPDLPHFELRP
jgi:hypothetical protein